MHRLSLLALCSCLCLLWPLAANAQDEETEAGFRLGRFAMGTSTLALELKYLASLMDEVKPGDVTDEAYAAGTVTDEDVEMANHALVYTIWRIQFYIDPTLEAVADGASFIHPVLEGYREPVMELIGPLRESCAAFIADPDLPALAAFAADLAANSYADDLLALSEEAYADAGVSTEE